MNVALIRFVGVDALRAQAWVAPYLCYLAAVALLDSAGASVLSLYASTSTVLLPVALWLAVAVVNSEDPVQTAITAVTAGGSGRVRLAKLTAAYLACLPLAGFAVGWPLLIGADGATGTALGAGLTAHLASALGGVGFGAMLSRPIMRRTAWVVLTAVAVTLADILVPGLPPAHQILAVLGRDHQTDLALPLASTAAQSALLAAVAFLAAERLARRIR